MDRSQGTIVRRPLSRHLLLAIVPLLAALEIPGVVELMQRPELGWKLRQTTVMVVEPHGPADEAGVRVGDRVRALDGVRVESWSDVDAALVGLRAGDTLRLTLLRDGEPRVLGAVLDSPPFDALVRTLLMRLSALTFLFLGFITYLRRDDELGRAFYVACVLMAFPFLDLPTFADRTWLRLATGLRDGLQALLAASLLRFLLIFPEGVREHRGGRYARQRWILAPALVLLPFHVGSALAPGYASRTGLETALLGITTLLFVGYVVAALVVFARKAMRREHWIQGSKIRVAALGLGAGVLPLTVAALARWVAPTHDLPLDEWAVLALPLVPASFSLALLRTGAIDLATLTRQALVTVFLAIPGAFAVWTLAGILAPRLDPSARPAAYVIVLVIVAGVLIAARGPARALAHGIDRVLYPERRRVRAVAERTGRHLSDRNDPAAVVDRFVAGMKELVDTDVVLVLEHEGARWVHRDAPSGAVGTHTLADDASLVEWMVRSREIVVLDAVRITRDDRFGPTTRAWVDRVGARVVAPLVASGEVVALLVLGRRTGDRSYGALHLYHVDGLCRQAGAALQNARMHQEDLQRERVRTELELAQQIQEQLLPQEPLRTDGFTVCGRTLPSRVVGGDLHDHFGLSDGSIVVVVADASGKGIPASLLTSGVRTAIRETIRPDLPLDQAVEHVNRHVHGMTHVGNFVALFVGVIDPRTGMTEYCVAGIEHPLWVQEDGRIQRLTRGGPVLGVDPEAHFQVGTIRLGPGDTLVAYTDGVIDEEDGEGTEFGMGKLFETLGDGRHLGPEDLCERIFARVTGHAAGDAVDDTTAVVVRRSSEGHIGTIRASA